jgi:hypothetical protein|tara:strand:+ start:416 stop:661 length:246 start_codon:yes stop_codon:yes gene_type:complete
MLLPTIGLLTVCPFGDGTAADARTEQVWTLQENHGAMLARNYEKAPPNMIAGKLTTGRGFYVEPAAYFHARYYSNPVATTD